MGLPLNKIAAVLALLIGAMSIPAGWKAMRGWNPGYSVLAWLPIYNFTLGVLTVLVPVVLLWADSRWAMLAALAIFVVHALVLIFLLTIFRGRVAPQSLKAMAFRLGVWIVILVLMLLQSRNGILTLVLYRS